MGLDVSAYSGISKTDASEDSEGTFRAWVNSDFPGRADEIEHRAVYAYRDSTGFPAGSYGGYNLWREKLARIAGYPERESVRRMSGIKEIRHDQGAFESDGGPFWELINFSDCEGVLGTKVCQKLAADFKRFEPAVTTMGDDPFLRKFKEWKGAFELASDGGCVEFH